ncbi:MAG TPA: hydroxymethylbilane synthase [Acidimicrobiales bacterium]|nr:hydroxymethylbilane synthase [Acidimicrobiales bacterium]
MLRLATRGSELALWQAHRVAALLRAAHPGLEVALVPVTTAGDRRTDVPVWEMGGRGVFVGEVQEAVLGGAADAAVHSAKDLQPVTNAGLSLAALPERADPRDVLVGATLASLPTGATVATGSQRRRAQLAHARPDLDFVSLRGNIATRLRRVPPGGAIVVAKAALDRLGLSPGLCETLDAQVMLPQVSQGVIAVECREGDQAVAALLAAIDDEDVRAAAETERGFLAAIGGACDLPVAAHAIVNGTSVHIEGLLASPDGKTVVRRSGEGGVSRRADLGRSVAEAVLAGGGRELLAAR